ncbi:MAG: MarR family winged helix-turn-helix transcriptional regulator [Dehalococcoidales bacterium]|nr:MarR family winged helix-turn-helix transcriptional regulator [Dehalococcoidales bacterium]
MQSLAKETIPQASPSDCSAQLIEVTPVIMRRIRGEMRRRTIPGLTVPQFRALNYLQRHPRSSLSDVAAHLGITLPSTSKLVQNLVVQKVVLRRSATDRRRVCLSLTQQGITALAVARLETQRQLDEVLSSLKQDELATVSAALRILNTVFAGGSTGVDIH